MHQPPHTEIIQFTIFKVLTPKVTNFFNPYNHIDTTLCNTIIT